MDFRTLKKHDRNNTSCKFPPLKCVCVENARYERLNEDERVYEMNAIAASLNTSNADLVELNFGPESKDDSTEKQANLTFYNDDGSFQSVVVEKNLRASDLCQLLALRNRSSGSINWCIIEYWPEFGIERILEDHEYVLVAFQDIKTYSRNIKYKFIFRKEYRKYEFFHDPQQFFPSDMIQNETPAHDGNVTCSNNSSIHQLITHEGQTPTVFSHMWLYDRYKHTWGKAYLLLKDKTLYYSNKVQSLAKFVRTAKSVNSTSLKDDYGVSTFAKLSDFQVYATLNAKNQFRAPTEWGICLRPAGLDSEDSEGTGLLCLSCDSEKGRTCWLTAMRLAKYGKQLRENYRAFKNKQTESINPKDYNSFTVPNESVRSRVAMDFTGSVGRIVDDPKEAKAIAVAEGYSWKRRWRPSCRTQTGPVQGIESGVHITQPWFHSGMSRDQASALVSRHGTVDGVFLVRESRSNQGAFVLTYKFGGKVLHAQISPIRDPVREAHVFSLDSGVTKFYDLLQLVEFYQLNAGCLPTRLTHYVVQSTNIINNTNSNTNSPSGK